ncbi:unnamed protein product [Prorocentrum cordatum]|uniref:Uncharacterized protein n=1 Tax=Prorocentrum cordatum TaxID=2364126 RepID=A0ABN9TPZ4_9DINO|nr:unnamed protein product [Polarella glacialis]
MCAWLNEVFTWAKARSSVLWGFDLNDSSGLCRQRGAGLAPVQSPALGRFGVGEQRFAGDWVLEIFERCSLKGVSMSFSVGNTYFGHGSSSPIDYVVVCEWQARYVVRCLGLKRSNLRLKLIRKQRLQDHVPTMMRVPCDFDISWSRLEVRPVPWLPRDVS